MVFSIALRYDFVLLEPPDQVEGLFEHAEGEETDLQQFKKDDEDRYFVQGVPLSFSVKVVITSHVGENVGSLDLVDSGKDKDTQRNWQQNPDAGEKTARTGVDFVDGAQVAHVSLFEKQAEVQHRSQ